MGLQVGFVLLLLAGGDFEVSADRAQAELLSGSKFDRALEAPGPAATWTNVELRGILHAVSEQKRIGILLDRRVDPTVAPNLSLVNETLFDSLATIAKACSASACVGRNVVVIGPREPLAKLRTLIQLRIDELFREEANIPEIRRLELSKGMTLHFGDLETPAALLDEIASRYSLDIQGRDLVPHDLWAGATFPEVDAVTALSLVLNQFDLTFEWKDHARSITIIPVPDVVQIERRYQTRGTPAAKAAESWKETVEGIETEVHGNEVVVRGTAEQQDALAAHLRPHSNHPTKSQTSKQPVPLRKREFTLAMRRVPAEQLMKKLEESGISFEYDQEALKAVGVDFKSAISVNVKQVSADEFFHAVFDQLKVSFTIENATVKLKPQ